MKAATFLLTVLVCAFSVRGDPRVWDHRGVPVIQNGALEWERSAANNDMGSALVVWSDMHTGNREVYAQMINPQGESEWGTNGIAVTEHPARQSNPAAVASQENWIIGWIDYRDEPQGGNVWLQKLDMQGNWLWSGGIRVDGTSHDIVSASLRLVPAANGEAWIVWVGRIGFSSSLLVQRVSRLGVIAWPDPISVVSSGSQDWSFDVATDDSGGIILAWSQYMAYDQRDIRATRILMNGTRPWGEYITVAGLPPLIQGEPKLCPDGSGGIYISWSSYIGGAWDVDLWAQRLNASGEAVWPAGAAPICTLPNYRGHLTLIPSRSGSVTDGCLLAWMDQREYGYDQYFAQKLSAAGTCRWAENGILLCDSANSYQTIACVSDGSGGLVCTWEDESNCDEGNWEADISAIRLNSQGQLAWPMEHMPVLVAPMLQSLPYIAVQPEGYLIVFRSQDERNVALLYQKLNCQTGERLFSTDGVNLVRRYNNFYGWAQAVPMSGGRTAVLWNERDVYYLILDSLGHVEGDTLGRPIAPLRLPETEYGSYAVSSVCPDDAGGFFAACIMGDDERGYLSFLTHVLFTGELASDSAGEWLWGDDWYQGQWKVAVAPDGQGGCFAAFAGVVDWQQGLYVRRFDLSCLPLWEGVVQVTTHVPWYGQDQKIVAQPDGGCLVAFGTDTRGLAVARVSPAGSLSWTTSICDSTAHGFNFRFGFVPDGQNGAYCVWHDSRFGFDSFVFAQNITAAGSLSWQEGGILVADSSIGQSWPCTDVDPEGNLFVAWQNAADATDDQIMAQKISQTGIRLWGDAGVPVCAAPSGQYYPVAVSDQLGGLFVVWSDYRLQPGPVLAGSHFGADGAPGPDPFWAAELGGVLSDSTLGIVYEPLLVASSSGTAVAFWVLDRQQSSEQILDLSAQRIAIGEMEVGNRPSVVPTGFSLRQNYPNPFNSATSISFELPRALHAKLTIHDLLGREVATLTNRVLPAGQHEYLFDASDLASGVYFYRLEAGRFANTRKMVLIR